MNTQGKAIHKPSTPTDAGRARKWTRAKRAAAPNVEQSLPRDASRGRHSDTWKIRRTIRAMLETSSMNQIRVVCAILICPQRIYNFFIVPCYYIICFGCLMGFIIHFYTIFLTNLLTGGPVQIVVFFAYFSVSLKRNIKRNPNGMKPSRGSFLEQTQSRRLGVDVKEATRRPQGREARLGG